MRLGKDVAAEKVGDQWLVVSHRYNTAHHLSGPAATVIDCVTSGQKIPEGYDDTVTGLITLGVLEPAPGLSRRQVISTAAAATAIGVTSVALPAAAFASSSDSPAPDPGPPAPAPMVWGSVNTPVDLQWRSVAHGNGKWIAVANSGTGTTRAMTSTDGTSWSTPSIGLQDGHAWWAVATDGGGKWVALASSPTTAGTSLVRYSTNNGVTWLSATVPDPLPDQDLWRSVAYGLDSANNPLWVATSNRGTVKNLRSSDGQTWTRADADQGVGLVSVAYGQVDGGNGFVAVGSGGHVRTTTNGNTWTTRTSGTTNALESVAYGQVEGANGWVAVGANGWVMTSPDAVTWTPRTTPADGNLQSVAYGKDDSGNPLWVAVGAFSGTERLITSPDGITWTAQPLPAGTENYNWWSIATDGDGVWIAVTITSAPNQVLRFPAPA